MKKLTNGGKPHICNVPAIHNTPKNVGATLCSNCFMPVDVSKKEIIKNTVKIVVVGLMFLPLFSYASIDYSLSYGSRGSEVTELQEFLIDHSYLTGNATGNFYSLTLKAVKKYQLDNGLPNTGYVGVLTRGAINKEILADISAGESEQIAETGTTTPAKPQNDVLIALQAQNALLQQQIAAQAKTNQSLQNVIQNTMPTPEPVPEVLVPTTLQFADFYQMGAPSSIVGGNCKRFIIAVDVLDQHNRPMNGQTVRTTNPETGETLTGTTKDNSSIVGARNQPAYIYYIPKSVDNDTEFPFFGITASAGHGETMTFSSGNATKELHFIVIPPTQSTIEQLAQLKHVATSTYEFDGTKCNADSSSWFLQ